MQFNPVVLSVEMPVCKIFVTKIQKSAPYNIVLDIKRRFYTYKHLKGYNSD